MHWILSGSRGFESWRGRTYMCLPCWGGYNLLANKGYARHEKNMDLGFPGILRGHVPHLLFVKCFQSWYFFRQPPINHTGWSGGAKVLCILHHWGVQLILACSWARPAILVVGKGRGGMFLFLLFLHFHSCSSFFPVPLFHLLYSLFYLFSPFLWETTQNDPQGLTCP